ncbi:MAG: hypothetical protein EBS48_07840 [Actinobacteria bacterium]|nr:hypothetical protein [Actinomycetota bacterium]
MTTTHFLGILALKAAPTRSHVPALWECLLGTVYARNAQGETRYFDYDHEAALDFSGVRLEGAEPRVARAPRRFTGIRKGQTVLWVRRPVQSIAT